MRQRMRKQAVAKSVAKKSSVASLVISHLDVEGEGNESERDDLVSSTSSCIKRRSKKSTTLLLQSPKKPI